MAGVQKGKSSKQMLTGSRWGLSRKENSFDFCALGLGGWERLWRRTGNEAQLAVRAACNIRLRPGALHWVRK